MRRVLVPHGYPAFREVARRLLAADVPPSEVALTASARPQVVLTDDDDGLPPPCEGVGPITVPLSFVRRSARVLCHRAPEVVDLTYRLLWRVTHGERRILADPAHPDVQAFLRMEEAVVRDVHAFVAAARFAPFPGPPRPGLIAFHAPAHRTARLAAARFASQLRGRPFVVATLDEVALFDGAELSFGPPPEVAPGPKELAPWWQGYYATQADALGALAEPGELFALREAAPWPGASAAPGPAVPTGAGLGPLKAGAAGCLACPRGRRGGFVFGDVAPFHGLVAQQLRLQPGAVVPNLDDDLAAFVVGADADLAALGLADDLPQGGGFDAVVYGVAQDVEQRVGDVF